jgi:hypothetical protein
MIEEKVIALLVNDVGVAALAGSRVYPGVIPQASPLPAIAINVVSAVPVYSDDGEDGIEGTRLQVDSYGDTYRSAKLLARAVKAVLSAYQGDVIEYGSVEGEDDAQEEALGAEPIRYRTRVDFEIAWRSI